MLPEFVHIGFLFMAKHELSDVSGDHHDDRRRDDDNDQKLRPNRTDDIP